MKQIKASKQEVISVAKKFCRFPHSDSDYERAYEKMRKEEKDLMMVKLERKFLKYEMGIILIILGLIAIACFVASAKAEPITIVRVIGPNAVSESQALIVAKYARRMLKRVQIGGLVTVESMVDAYPTLNTIDDSLLKHQLYKVQLSQSLQFGSLGRYYIMMPPMVGVSGYQGYIGGFSQICQPLNKPRYSTGNAIWKHLATGEGRIKKSAIVMAHEIGHMMGAQHDDSDVNVMHPAANSVWPGGLLPKWNVKAKLEILNCE